MIEREKLRKTYESIGEKYFGYRRKLWPEAVDFLKSIRPSRILDIGSGNAYYAKTIEKMGHRLVLSDFAFNQIKVAKRVCANCPAVVFDAIKIPVKDESFSTVTAFAVLHHLPNRRDRLAFLNEIKRVLNPRGNAFLTVLRTEKGGFDADIPFAGESRYYHFFSEKELKELFDKTGFSKFEITSSELTDKRTAATTTKTINVDGKLTKLRLGNYFIKLKK